MEQVGVPNRILGYLFVFFTLAVYGVIGVAMRTAQVSEYYVAGRVVPAFYNGMATGADWMSAASFVGMAGSLFLLATTASPGCSAGPAASCWCRSWSDRTCASSVPTPCPTSWPSGYGGNFARFLAVVVLVCCPSPT